MILIAVMNGLTLSVCHAINSVQLQPQLQKQLLLLQNAHNSTC